MSRGTHEQLYAQVFKIEDGGVVVLVHQRQMEYVLAKRLRKPQIIDEQRNAFNVLHALTHAHAHISDRLHRHAYIVI
jgi:hypothetical protein